MPRYLTELQAFDAMVEFLTTYASETHSDQIDALLLDLGYSQLSDDAPVTLTPGYWADWRAAVAKTLPTEAGGQPID